MHTVCNSPATVTVQQVTVAAAKDTAVYLAGPAAAAAMKMPGLQFNCVRLTLRLALAVTPSAAMSCAYNFCLLGLLHNRYITRFGSQRQAQSLMIGQEQHQEHKTSKEQTRPSALTASALP
jgi:hypothetical protein